MLCICWSCMQFCCMVDVNFYIWSLVRVFDTLRFSNPFFFKILLLLLQLTFHKNFLSLWQSSRLFFSMRKDLDFSDCIGSVPEFWYISWALSFPYFPYWGYYYLQGPKIFLLASPESFSCAVHSYPDWFWNHTIKISLNQLFSSSLFA